jgi:hypothetical protein
MVAAAMMRRHIDRSIAKALVASSWVYGGRGVGLLWLMGLNLELGVSQYGYYALAVGIAPLVATPLESPFIVRSIRVDDQTFRAERSTRVLVGTIVAVSGFAMTELNYVAGYALVIAGGEIVFNSLKATHLRDGNPNIVNRLDTIRQVSGVAAGFGGLFLIPHPTILAVSLCYSIPYVVLIVVALVTVPWCRPRFPGGLREAATLASEALVNAANMQGDLLVLGFLTDSTVAGYYSLASVTAWALVTPAQAYGQTFHESLRLADGALAAAPPLLRAAFISVTSAVLLILVGAALLALSPPPEIAYALIALSPFVFGRSMTTILAIIMYAQHRDGERFLWALPVLPIKLGMVALAANLGWGAVSAGLSCSVAEILLLIAYLRLIKMPEVGIPQPARDEGGSQQMDSTSLFGPRKLREP